MDVTKKLSILTNDELKDLLNSNVDVYVTDSEDLRRLQVEQELLMASVKSLAEFNLSRRADYESERNKLLFLVSDSNKLREEIKEKASKLLELSKRTSLETTLAAILVAAAQAEEESEKIAGEFLENTMDYEVFLSAYCEKRTLAHLRRIKADRLQMAEKLAA